MCFACKTRVAGLEDDIPEGHQRVPGERPDIRFIVNHQDRLGQPYIPPCPKGQSLVPPSRMALPESARCVALLRHAALVPGHRHVLTDEPGRKKDNLTVRVLAHPVVEVELCI